MQIEIVIGDITNQPDVDAIVNAAKPSLLGGGGVDGAVHRAAGPELVKECEILRTIDGGNVRCPAGHAVVTSAYDLPNEKIIHTVGPIYKDLGEKESAVYLRAAYTNSIVMGLNSGVRSFAFPAIGTGIYGYPLVSATIIAIKTMLHLHREADVDMEGVLVRFVCFDEENFLVYREVLEAAMRDWELSYILD